MNITRRFASLVISIFVLAAVMAPASAGTLKLDAACAELETTDVTSIDNPSCTAITAVYFDRDGNAIYSEILERDDERKVKGRLVKIVRGCASNDRDCPGGCARAACSRTIGTRIICIC